jgi:SAM-dependent methyltransferase
MGGVMTTLRNIAKAFVPKKLRQPIRRLQWALASPRPIHHNGSVLPSSELRASMCGTRYADNEFFLNSAVTLARELVKTVELTSDTRIVDVGCGLGRLAIGLARQAPDVRYFGLDSSERFICWCTRYIQRAHPNFRFMHIDVENERYNPGGRKIGENFRLPVADGDADVVHFWGVLTNMTREHMLIYVPEISRILRRGGSAFLTAFVEKNIPFYSVNPSAYVSYPCVGPLHVVRYEETYLRSVFASQSLSVKTIAYHTVDENQSEIHLEKL